MRLWMPRCDPGDVDGDDDGRGSVPVERIEWISHGAFLERRSEFPEKAQLSIGVEGGE